MDLNYRVISYGLCRGQDGYLLVIPWWRADNQTWRSNCPELRRATMLEF